MEGSLSYFFFVLVVVLSSVHASSDNSGCPNRVFLGCVLRLKAQRVPFEKNILNVIFNIGSEARLMHTCKAYGEIMPCFRDKILECGNDKQRRMLNEVGKTLMFLCSPFSVERQRLLMRHQKCIGEILALPATVGCKLHDSYHGKQLLKCRELCAQKPTDFTCMLKAWISEQNVCTLRDIHDKCGNEASTFYTELQSTVFEPLFPVLCDYPVESVQPPITLPMIIPTTEATTVELTTFTPPRTVISLPTPKNMKMIQPPRIRPMSRAAKQKPADEKPYDFWSPNPGMLPLPENQIPWNRLIYYKNKSALAGFSATTAPMVTTPIPLPRATTPIHNPFASIFKKILPNSIPERFSSFFKEEIPQPKKAIDPWAPIAAKEIFELHTEPTVNLTIITTTALPSTTTITTTTTPEEPTTTILGVSESFTPVAYPKDQKTPSSLPLSVFSFTSEPKTGELQKKPSEKWRPWYLGGFSQMDTEEKFRMPLYHGAR